MIRRSCRVLTFMLLATLLAGCSFGGGDGTLTYNGPTEQTIAMNESLPGADIRYVGYSEDGAVVLIDDMQAIKKVGDSLDWKGTPVSGVKVTMTQRIVAANTERLQTVGTVRVDIDAAQPELATYPDNPAYEYKAALTYTVRRGDVIPGTLITYKGKTDNGAEFEGVSGYPYRKLGDSVSWSGRLRANAYIDMTLRVTVYTEDFVTLVGLADIGLV